MNSDHIQKPRLFIAAAYDPSGGAGVLADCRAAALMRTSAAACLTALTVQSSRRLERVVALSGTLLDRQLKRLVRDDGPPDGLKIGALSGTAQVEVLSRFLKRHPVPAVYDPVVSPTRGAPFVAERDRRKFLELLLNQLFPRLTLVTPNMPEFHWIFGGLSPEQASRELPCALLLKGGHQGATRGPATTRTVKDCFYDQGKLVFTHTRPRINMDIHGTGCVMASLIAAGLARRWDLVRAVQFAEKRMNSLILKAAPARPGAVATLLP